MIKKTQFCNIVQRFVLFIYKATFSERRDFSAWRKNLRHQNFIYIKVKNWKMMFLYSTQRYVESKTIYKSKIIYSFFVVSSVLLEPFFILE